MDFPDLLLTEHYIISPYKLCIANYLQSYMEQKNAVETQSDATTPNPLSHCYLGFRLMMSLDCSYAELRSQLVAPVEVSSRRSAGEVVCENIDPTVLQKFDANLAEIQSGGISRLYDFVKKVQKVLAKKPGTQLGKHHHSNCAEDLYRIHRLSMAGLFLRKFIIHFEKLDFNEVAILNGQLERYLQGETDFDYLPVKPANPVLTQYAAKVSTNVEKTPTKKSTTKQTHQRTGIDLNSEEISKLDRLEAKLAVCDKDSELVRHLKSLIAEVRLLQVKNIRGFSNMSSTEELHLDGSNSSASSMSLDDTTESELSVLKLRKKQKVNQDGDLDHHPTPSSDFSKFHSRQTSQHFLLKQVSKILINEHSALSPPVIVDFINYYFEQHNRFYYNQYIKLNYRANLEMIKRSTAGVADAATAAAAGAVGSGAVPGGAANPGGVGVAGGTINGTTGATGGRKVRDLFPSINHHGDIHYLKFINALRVNNYTAAQEFFFTYFDLKKTSRLAPNSGSNSACSGPNQNNLNPSNGSSGVDAKFSSLHTSGSNFCWSALNLAIMYAHFRHYRLAYEALTDCISVAREKRDERCLQYAMIWLLLVLQQFNSSNFGSGKDAGTENSGPSTITNGTSSTCRADKARVAELSTRHHKAYNDLNLIQNLINLIALNELGLPYIAAMGYLHLEKAIYLRPIYPSLADQELGVTGKQSIGPRRPPLTTKPLVLAVRFLLDDITMKCYASHAAVLNAYGAVHLGAVLSTMLGRLELVDMVDQEMIAHVCESQAIACRNQAFYIWHIRGDARRAMELLNSFTKYYSCYNNQLRMIIEQAKAEITFERAIYSADWATAKRAVSLVRLTNRTAALMMLAEMNRRQKEPIAALECIDLIVGGGVGKNAGGAKNSRIPFVGATLSGGANGFVRGTDGGGGVDGEESVVIAERTMGSFKNLATPIGRHSRLKSSTMSTPRSPRLTSTPISPSPGPKTGATARLPSTLEPEEERPLTVDLDPYAWINCQIMKATILGDLSGLLDAVVKSQAHGFRILETRALLEIARIQQALFGQCAESQAILNSLMIRLVANGALKDLATAYFLTATNHFVHHQKGGIEVLMQMPLRYNGSKACRKWTSLDAATWANERAMAIWKRIAEKTALLESLNLQAFIEHERGTREQRNFYAKQANLMRAELLK